jgi:hypothetical protein
MAEKIFFHVGLPKSGTTYLQTIMWQNRRRLRRQGWLYPGEKRFDHYNAFRGGHGGPGPDAERAARTWDSFVDALAQWPGTGFVSHEFWSTLDTGQAAAAIDRLRPADVEIVITVRDYVRQFTAVWQEALKMQATDSFGEFMTRALDRTLEGPWSWLSQDAPAVAERWAAAVGGADRVTLVTLPPAGAQRDVLWNRWTTALGFDDTGFTMSGTGNESVGSTQAALLHRVKPFISAPITTKPEFHRWVRQYFGHEVLVPQAGPRYAMRPEEAAALREQAIADVARLRGGGYRVVGELDDLVPPPEPPSGPHPDDATEAEQLDVAARAIDQMIRDVRALTIERNEWRRRAREAEAHHGLARRGGRRLRAAGRAARGRLRGALAGRRQA